MHFKEDKKQRMEFEIGSILEGRVTGITKFGAFVALPGGRSGLVHISEIAHSYVNDVRDFLTEGQEVRVRVISVDENHRINLSIKRALPPPPPRPPRPGRPPHPNGGPHGGGPHGGRPPRPEDGGHGGHGGERPRSGGGHPASHGSRSQQPREPASFEDRLKQFMQESDSRQSDLNRYIDKRGSRRGNGSRRG